MEDVVGADLVDNAVKSVGVNADFSPVLVEVAGAPVLKERKLRYLLDRGVPE